MKLEKNEYTTKKLIDKLTKTYKTKLTGKPFDSNDIMQYIIKGQIPHRYGGGKITATKVNGVRIITLH
jgi:hypothetical protein